MHIETDRLILRDFEPADWRDVHVYANQVLVYQFMPWGPNTEQDTIAFINHVIAQQSEEPRRSFELAIVLKDSPEVIGAIGIRKKSEANGDANIGYTLRQEHWNKGIMTEAVSAIFRFGFNTLNLHRIWATVDPENIGSQKVMQKSGMQKEGYLRENILIRDQYRDSFLYAILKSDF